MRATSMRTMAIAVAIAGPWAGVVATASPGSAAGASAKSSCESVTATVNGTSGKLGGCTIATTGGSGVIKGNGKTNVDVVTWANGRTTTVKFTNAKLVTPDVCAAGYREFHIIGKVTASTGPSASISGGVSAVLCESTSLKGKVFLLPGSDFTF